MQTLAVPPHIRHALADTTSLGADTPYRCNGRTRHIPTGSRERSGGCSGMYSPISSSPPYTGRRLSLQV